MTRSSTRFPSDYTPDSGRPSAWRVTGGTPIAAASAGQLLAAWAVVLHWYTGETDLVFGGPGGVAVELSIDPEATLAALTRQAARLPAAAADEASARFRVDVQRPDRDELTVSVQRGLVQVGYDGRLFEEDTASRIGEHYVEALELALRQPDTLVRELRPAARPQDAWQAPSASASAEETLAGRFRAIVARSGDRLAVHGPSGAWTYRELDAASDALAARIRPAVGRGDRVALLLGHDIELVRAVLAVLKAGAAYVPLDPQQPRGRLAAIVADTDPALILADEGRAKAAEQLAEGRPVVLAGPALAPATVNPAPVNPALLGPARLESDGAPEELACVLPAAGTTGAPIGLMQTNRNMLTHALRFAHRLGLTAQDRVPMIARYTVGSSMLDMFGALLTGASLHVIDPYLAPPSTLLGDLARQRVTVLRCTPSLLRLFLAQLESGAPAPEPRVIVLGGEEMTGRDVAGAARHFTGAELVNWFGVDECPAALHHRVEAADADRASVPVGRPVEGIEVSLIDRGGRPAALVGELVLAGDGVAPGYWNQPELTARAFGTRADGVRFYRTGDMVRLRPDGELVRCGRRDDQVMSSGYRAVEPAEAEVMLRAHPTVRHAAVVADPDGPPGGRLTGYVTSPGPQGAIPEELLRYLHRALPAYAVPARIVTLPRLPTGPDGRLDRSRLPAVPGAEEADDTLETARERQLAALWCEVLARETAARRDHFFASGGDSVRVMRLLERVKAQHGVAVSLPAFLAEPTLVTLARLVAVTADGGADQAQPGPSEDKPKADAVLEQVTAAWGEVFDAVPSDLERTFVDCGGNSILAIRLQQALLRRTGTAVSIAELLEHKTIGAQVAYITSLPERKE